jgi:hypothetical protein
MARAKRKPKKTEEQLVNPFAAKHGDYRQTTIAVTAGEFEDEAHGNKRVTINRGGSTLQRWIATEQFTPGQLNAINHYTRAWHRVFSEPRVTANLSPIAFIRTTGSEADRNATKIDALELLKFLDERIFDMCPSYYRDVWQDVMIYNRDTHPPSGKGRMTAQQKQKTICAFIADMIATALRL